MTALPAFEIGIDDVRTAQARLAGIITATPMLSSPALDERCGVPLVCKAENLQRTGSFKLRGALNHVLSLDERARGRGIVAASSGNHAQAVAFAARYVGTRAVVVVPEDAPAVKVSAVLALGAEVVTYRRGEDDRDALVAEIASTRGLAVVPSADSPAVIAGAGTVAAEMVTADPRIMTVVVPVGGGGLAAGCAVAAKALDPGIRVVGVEPETACDTMLSLSAGHREVIPQPRTIADGLTHTTPAALPFAVNCALLDQLVTVTDEQITAAMAACFRELKVVIEPSGACALAAAMFERIAPGRGLMGVVLSGGNTDWKTFLALTGRIEDGEGDGLSGLRENGHGS